MKRIPKAAVVILLCFSMLTVLKQTAAVDSLVGYWKFDEGSGTIASDSSGNGNTGTLNGPQWVTGLSGTALSFDGTDDYVSVPDSPVLKASGTEISVELWFKPATVLDSNTQSLELLDKGNEYTFLLNLAPYQPVPNGKMVFLLNFEGVGRNWVETTTDQWATGEWCYLVGTYDGSYMRIYVNGTLENISPFSANLHSESFPLAIGSYTLGSQWFFNGVIDEVKIYNYARSLEEISNDYSSMNTPSRPVGGEWIPTNGLQLLTLLMGLVTTAAIATSFVGVRRIKKRQD